VREIILFWKVIIEAEETFVQQMVDCRYTGVLQFSRDIASYVSAYCILRIIDCKSAYYVEIMTKIHEVVCRQNDMNSGR
jgi:hypothetical protein